MKDYTLDSIFNSIVRSKKYKHIYEKTVKSIITDCLNKYDRKKVEKEVRKILHQMYDAYYKIRPNFGELIEETAQQLKLGIERKEIVKKILLKQSSTRERIQILDRFYVDIFRITGIPRTIIDHACGLNPLTIHWMNLPEHIKYYAYDIDTELINFIESISRLFGLQDIIIAKVADVLTDQFPYADVVFMLKLLPILERRKKGSSIKAMREQRCKFLVTSFPTTSLSGDYKGMTEFYPNWFKELIKDQPWSYELLHFETEIVFIVDKGQTED